MQRLKPTDYSLLERLFSLTQKELKATMGQYLAKNYDKVVNAKKYCYAVGNIPICLVAHMDTVYSKPVKELFYDERKNVLWSPDGLGADDRAGVFAILKILKAGYRPHIILTTDEEKGGIGATALAKKGCPFPELKYMIELDRQGTNDCVFYDVYNPDFTDYIEDFGFMEAFGSYSDICEFSPKWKVCSVNLSIGYKNEHSYAEYLAIGPMFDTIEKVKKMLDEADNAPCFEYREMPYYANWWKAGSKKAAEAEKAWACAYGYPMDDIGDVKCDKCHHWFSEYEVFPVKGLDGEIKFYCPDCLVGNIEWCPICGEPFEINGSEYCCDCLEAKNGKTV